MNKLHIKFAFNNFTFICNVMSVPVEVVDFATVKFDIICEYNLITVYFKLFDWKNARIVNSKSEPKTNLSIWMFNDVFMVLSKEVIF